MGRPWRRIWIWRAIHLGRKLYDEEYQLDDDAGIGDEEQEEYDELWADELWEIASPEIPPPPRVSLKTFHNSSI